MERNAQLGLLTLTCVVLLGAVSPSRNHTRIPAQPNKRSLVVSWGTCELTTETLTRTEWRLYDLGISVLPSEGYPIAFLPGGKLRSRNLGSMDRWQLDEHGIISLHTKSGDLGYQFDFDPENCILVSLQCDRAQSIPVLIGPKGTDFYGYLETKCPSRFRRIPSTAAPN